MRRQRLSNRNSSSSSRRTTLALSDALPAALLIALVAAAHFGGCAKVSSGGRVWLRSDGGGNLASGLRRLRGTADAAEAANAARSYGHQEEEIDWVSKPLIAAGRPVGFRRRRPTAVAPLPLQAPLSVAMSDAVNGDEQLEEQVIVEKKKSDEVSQLERQLAYFMSPLSGQLVPIVDSAKLAQSQAADNNLLASLANAAYTLGLQNSPLLPASFQRLESRPVEVATEELSGGGGGGECRTIRSSLELTRDEQSLSGRVVRTCRGQVQLNRCEGSCTSSIEPSIKSRTGFKKHCSCCNELTFRRVQVRLNQCVSSSSSPLDSLEKASQEGRQQEAEGDSGRAANFMDIEVDEPIECRCRPCNAVL